MKIFGKRSLCKAATVVAVIAFILGIITYATIPFWVKGYIHWRNMNDPGFYTTLLAVLYPAGLGCLIIFYFILRLLSNINRNQAFILQNVKILKGISLCCLFVAIVFIVSVFFIDSIFSFFIVLAFSIASVIFYIIAELFRVATRYKEENDLTI